MFVARQRVITTDLRLFGHEVSTRDAAGRRIPASMWGPLEHERATREVLLATFGRDDVVSVTESLPLLVRAPRPYLVGDFRLPAGPDRLILEVADGVCVDHTVLEGIARLREQGYRVALRGFVGRPDQRMLLPQADLVKIDVRDLDVEGRAVVELARSCGALLVGEFIESRPMLEQACELGLDLLQGDLIAAPEVIERTAAVPRQGQRSS